jgi:hypothetical protein
MPTAVEYAVMKQWHTQNGCGGAPPVQNVALTQDLTPPSSEPPIDPLTALLLVVAVVAAVRRVTARHWVRRAALPPDGEAVHQVH